MNCIRFCLVIFVSLYASAESIAQVALPEGISLYAGGDLVFESSSTISGGSVVSGGDVTHNGGSLNVDQISAVGEFVGDGGFQNSLGPFLFNGNISEIGGPGSVFDGPVTSTQGSIDFSDTSTTINGDVTAAGGVEFEFVFGTINGNVSAGGPINITADVTGTTTSAAANLTPFTLEPLPAGRSLSAGTTDVKLTTNFKDLTLAPGTYGTLTFASVNTVTLTAGSYVFEDIVSDFSLNELNFDTTAGNIDLFVANNDFVFDNLVQTIDGVSLFGSDSPAPELSNNIFIEAAGNLTLGAEFFGTIFAPNGDVTIESFSDINGRVFAGGNVTVNSVDILTTAEVVPDGILGDANLDGVVNFLDIGPFISILTSNDFLQQADCNEDNVVDFLDIAPLIAILSGS